MSQDVESARPAPSEDEDIIDLREYAGILYDARLMIAAITIVGLFIAVIVATLSTPQYTASALLQVEMNQGPGLAALEDVSGLFETENSVDSEIELIQSRMVLGEAVKRLGLDVHVKPNYFPIIGETLARRFKARSKPGAVAQPMLGLDSYAWGGEYIKIDVFETPRQFENQNLRIVVGENGNYILQAGGQTLLKGQAGTLSQATFDAYDENGLETIKEVLQLQISTLRARPGTEFIIQKQSLHVATNAIASQLSIAEKGKKTGIISLSLTSPKPNTVAKVLNTISDVYVEQNVERGSAEAELSLQFLEEQLPPLKEQLDAAENAYNLFRVQNSSIDLQEETRSVLVNMNTVNATLLELQQERNQLRKKYKSIHPLITALDGKIAILESEEQRLEANTDTLPAKQKDILRLAREVEMNSALYSKLLSTTQELKVAKAGTVGSVRVVDYGVRPLVPSKPNKKIIIVLGAMLALFLAVVLAFVLRAIRGGVSDPAELERKLGTPVYGAILHSKEQVEANKRAGTSGETNYGILAANAKDTIAVECLRSLRTSLHFSLQNAANNRILIAGASSGIGKTFTAINLGAVLADAGKKVLVIDADLRRGTLHKYIGIPRGIGLAELIVQRDFPVTDFVQATSIASLDIITSGKLPANPAELLLHDAFEHALNELSAIYDYVIMDAPPILAVTDAAIVGKHAATTLMVVKSDFHQMPELTQAQLQFEQAGIFIKGLVLNDIKQSASATGYGRYVYRYEYQSV